MNHHISFIATVSYEHKQRMGAFLKIRVSGCLYKKQPSHSQPCHSTGNHSGNQKTLGWWHRDDGFPPPNEIFN